ncbi:leucine-rich repeat protein kinase family protein [Striga asiatica]|uniref:Leucine-rich repeat protein kinase family protein n=1 Tax=Striga asiatica TaxID=4170 RepID=A0A5A7QYY1_STRAF|nr:leucine-rich repeat protein kinase family protein [Striga asiatica]
MMRVKPSKQSSWIPGSRSQSSKSLHPVNPVSLSNLMSFEKTRIFVPSGVGMAWLRRFGWRMQLTWVRSSIPSSTVGSPEARRCGDRSSLYADVEESGTQTTESKRIITVPTGFEAEGRPDSHSVG